MTEYRIIPFDEKHLALLPHPEEPFEVIGRLLIKFDGERWETAEQLLARPETKIYPSETFDPAAYIGNPEQAAFLAMRGEERVGSIRVCARWNGGALVEDLKVNRACRGQGVGRKLMDAAVAWAGEKGLNGVSVETQDNNLLACRFYRKYGFTLGGIDTKVYLPSPYRNETALYFYLPKATDGA